MSLSHQVPKWLGRLIALVGVFNVAANIFQPFKGLAHRIDSYTLVYVNSSAFSTSLFSGVLLILLSRGLTKRKKRAWNLAVILLALGIATETFRFHMHLEQISVNLLMLIVLVIFRDEFYAKSDPQTEKHPIRVFLIGFALLFSLSVLMLLIRNSRIFMESPSFTEILQTVLYGFIGVTGPINFATERIADTVHFILLSFGIATILFPIGQFFKVIKPINQISLEDAKRVKEILLKNPDNDSLSYFSTRLDKSIMWSDSQTAGQSYRVQNGVLLVSGDPFGHFSLWSEVIDKVIALADEYAWTLAVFGCGERAGELWLKKTEMDALHVGDEAVIRTKNFTLEGPAMKNVREMVNKTKRLGYSTEVYKVSELDLKTRELLVKKSVEWRYGEPERGFAMALDRFMNPIDDREIFVLARKDDEILAFMSFSPWSTDGMSLDRMLRSREAVTGVNELIISAAAEYGKSNGISRISLNFAAFRSIFEESERISAGPILRFKRKILQIFSKWVQVESLYRFNAKFQPEWNPRYLIYPGPTKLIEIGIAVGKAEGLI